MAMADRGHNTQLCFSSIVHRAGCRMRLKDRLMSVRFEKTDFIIVGHFARCDASPINASNSNISSHSRRLEACLAADVSRIEVDSALEEDGFEPSVPLRANWLFSHRRRGESRSERS